MFEKNRKSNLSKTLSVIFLSLIVVGAFSYFVSGRKVSKPTPQINAPNVLLPGANGNDVVPKPQQLSADFNINNNSTTSVAKSAIPGVVGISVLRVDGGSIFDGNTTEKWGVGSGIIADPNGYIITNNHVAGGKSKQIVVSLSNGKNVNGTTVWSDPLMDIAIVKINMTGLNTIPLGDSSMVQVGEPAIAIGNPLGLSLQRTVTSGIISAINRTIKIDTDQGPNYMEDLIQTDASINPGNSGGPLLNSQGQAIGINTIKVTSAEGIGFAIPINIVTPIIRQLVDTGSFKETYMGIFAYDKEVMPYINSNINVNNGIYISTVDKNGPAYKSGIKECCIITHVDGKPVDRMIELRSYLYSKKPGDVIKITHISKGKTENLSIKLAEKKTDGLLTR